MPVLSEGQQINRTYQVERYLGEGAFAEVYRVKHRFLGRQALKLFKTPGLTADSLKQQLDEAVLLSQVGHPNIIRVFEANVVDLDGKDFGYFTMEYVAGGSLDQYWRSFRLELMPVEAVVDLLRQACRGLAIAHGADPPIIHRDIKPQNLLLGYDGEGLRLRVSDFGLAKHANPLTMFVSARGTPLFKAPEVFRKADIDSRTGDVWAVGCTMYLLLTDQWPFPLEERPGLGMVPVFDRRPTSPSQYNMNVNADLDRIVLRALSLTPEQRYASAKEMLADLEQWNTGPMAPTAKPTGPAPESSKSILGRPESYDEQEAGEMASQALALSKTFHKLLEAADLMEQAFKKWPPLRDRYAAEVTLWRKGVLS